MRLRFIRTTPSKLRRLRQPVRRAFTLIELLVVIGVIGIISAIGIGVYFESLRVANMRSSENALVQISDALAEEYEDFFRDIASVSPSSGHINIANPAFVGADPYAVSASASANSILYRRAAVIAKLDAMRGDFPQQFIDFLRRDPDGTGARTGDILSYGSTNMTGLGDPLNIRPRRNAILAAYLKAVNLSTVNLQTTDLTGPSALPAGHDPTTESAECLYLIISTGVRSSRVLDTIPKKYIRDTDNDGLLEFVDHWDKPIRFFRWPTDYLAYLLEVRKALPTSFDSGTTSANGAISNLDPDGLLTDGTTAGSWFMSNARRGTGSPTGFERLGFYRLHQPYPNPIPLDLSSTNLASPGENSARITEMRAMNLTPLIVSAGPDKEFGLVEEVGRPPLASEMHMRGGRVDGLKYENSLDNLLNIKLVSGKGQE